MLRSCFLALALCLVLANPALAKVNVVGAYPYISDLARQIGQTEVTVSSLASGDWDPHFIVAKPSLLTRLRRADLLIINGAQLEIGWLPPLLRQANHAGIQPGSSGFLDLSNFVSKIQVPENISRAMGDVHPQGNPHFVLNPENIPKMADAITQQLCQLDNAKCPGFQRNNQAFKQRWQTAAKGWKQRMDPLKGTKVVEYHRLHDYFFSYYGLNLVGTLEALPGIPPTPQHLQSLVAKASAEKVQLNIRGVYHPQGPSHFVSQQTGARLVTLPHDVGATPEAKDIFGLYESLLKRLGV